MEKSLWQKDNYNKKLISVNDDLKTDILIIGAGISGITLAYNLIKSNYDVILIDRGKFYNELTAKSTGKINYLQDLIYQNINNIYSFDKVKLYYESQKDAIKIIRKNIKDNNIECDIKKTKSSVFTYDKKEIEKFKEEKELLRILNVKYDSNNNLLDNRIKDIITVNNCYVFNPVKYLNGLFNVLRKNKNIKMFENSVATKINKSKDNYIVDVNNYKITCKKLVMACNYPFFTIPFFMPLKTYIEKSFICASKVDKTKDIDGITTGNNVISFRYNYDNEDKYFIYLNNSSKLSSKLNYNKNMKDCENKIFDITKIKPTYKWMNMDVMTNDYIPYIGYVSEEDKNCFIMTGYNTWGITNSAIGAKVIFDLIMNKKNKYQTLFCINRNITIKKIKNLVVNTVFSNIKAYTFSLIRKNPSWYEKENYVLKIKGKRVGVYIDSKKKKHIVSNTCPHLKCFLVFNKVDKTWDCPCHGSRFNIDGNVIKGPSCYNIKIDESFFRE